MKLSELEPRWTVGSEWTSPLGSQFFNQDNVWCRKGMGLSFICPKCKSHRIAVFFSNPIDHRPPQCRTPLWFRQGETFETLTLTPSINTEIKTDCWHGFIINGEVQ